MATSYQEAVEKTIIASEQLNQIVNGTATAEVVVEDGSKIPSVRKALVDNFYFKDPLPWQQGQTETVFNQLRKFTDGTLWYAPTATMSNVITMGVTPVGDPLWTVYSLDAIPKLTPQIREALRRSYAEAGYTLVAGSFETGGILTAPNDVLLQESSGKVYSGTAGVVPPNTDPLSGGYVDRSNSEITVRTSNYLDLSSALDAAILVGASVIVDNVQNLTNIITKSLNGKDLTIISTSEGWINFTPQNTNTYYPIITLNGTGVESVLTNINLDGGKVRGVGRAIVGIVVNNVYTHYDGSEIRNISACVNTVTAKFHFCYGARYYNVFQQLSSQNWQPGVYGYGTVPIDCEFFAVDNCQFGVQGMPLDRHAVYGSSFEDGSGTNGVGFISNNKVIMRDYRTETPETTFERAFKCIGTKSVHLDNNDLEGGYGFALFTCRKNQIANSFRITNNRGRFFADAVLVTSQDSAADAPDATWYLDELVLGGDNVFRSQTPTSGVAAGVRYKNVKNIIDTGTRYYNEAYATSKALAVYIATADRIRADILDSRGAYYDKFQNIFRGEEPTNLHIDILAIRPDSTSSPSVPTTTAAAKTITVKSVDDSAAWKSGFTATAISGFGYFDPYFKKMIYSAGAGTWIDDAGNQVAGQSTSRPLSVPAGHVFYQVDTANYVRWTGSKWVLVTVTWSGLPSSGTTSQINSINKSLLGYGHTIYNIDTKKPVFFDEFSQVWKYADGAAM